MSLAANTLYYGDCLEWLPQFPSESVDLIYLDPPFNSNTNFNLLFGNGDQKRRNGGKSAQVRAFDDTWRWDDSAAKRVDRLSRAAAHPAHKAVVGLRTLIGEGGMLAYLSYMAERLAEMPRVLKPTGSIYLHCDPTASHGLKLVVDTIFGATNFRNEIVWNRSTNPKGSQHEMRRFSPFTDTILYYAKSRSASIDLDSIRVPLTREEFEQKYPREDEHGRYADGPILRSDSMGMRPNLVYSYKGFTPGPSGWRVKRKALEEIDRKGDLAWTKTGGVRRRLRPGDIEKGKPIGSLWSDIAPINSQAKERLGYPTQKPLALLERIIRASSKPGDMVLDPFCGCGTAVAAAHKLNRKWVGIDISPFAIDLIAQKRFPEYKIPTEGYPYDLAGAAKLASEQPFKFEKWAVTRVPGLAPNEKQVGDGGIDGIGYLLAKPEDTTDQVLAQVKGGKYHLGQLRDFLGVMEREQAAMGLYTTVEPIRAAGARTEATHRGFLTLGATEYPRAQLWSIQDYFDNRMPLLPALADPYTGKPVQQSLGLSLA